MQHIFIIKMARFSMPNSIPMPWMEILTACVRVSNSFSFSVKYCFYNHCPLCELFLHWLGFLLKSKLHPLSFVLYHSFKLILTAPWSGLRDFHTSFNRSFFQGSLREKSSQVSLNILAYLNSAVVLILSIRHLIHDSPSLISCFRAPHARSNRQSFTGVW